MDVESGPTGINLFSQSVPLYFAIAAINSIVQTLHNVCYIYQLVQTMKCSRLLGRTLLHIFVIFAGCVWTVLCFVLVMAAFCLVGACRNLAENRTGGCHDLPLMCKGIETSIEWSEKGWRSLWKLVETSRPSDVENGSKQPVVPPELARPPPARVRPGSNVGLQVDDRTARRSSDVIMGPKLWEI